MEMTQILKIGKELGLEGTDLLSFIDRKENEALEREERKERERLKRESKLVKDEQLTGRIQRCILIDGTVRSAPVAEILVDSPSF